MAAGTPPLRNLMAFDAAARLGSFSRAAEELAITQSAVSQQVQKLEEHVGQQLFLRTGSGVKLTAAGEILAATVRDTLTRLASGLERIEPYRNKNSVILGVPADFAHGWLAPRLAALQAMAPGFEVWLVVTKELREIDQVDVDLVVSRRPIQSADVECVPLLEDEAVAVCGPRLARRYGRLTVPKLLELAPLLFLEDQPNWGGLLPPGPSPGPGAPPPVHRAATADDPRTLLASAEHECGVAWLPRVLCAGALQSGRVVELRQVPSKTLPQLWLMRSRLPPRTPYVQPVFDWLRAAAAQSATR
jgi:LysR family transcriptional regulator, glycine cleavage system transcriptional activator